MRERGGLCDLRIVEELSELMLNLGAKAFGL
jgi:hypothetical protein